MASPETTRTYSGRQPSTWKPERPAGNIGTDRSPYEPSGALRERSLSLKLLRSWPAQVPPGRAHVDDGIERLVISDYRYDQLASIKDDVLLLEWDIACDPVDITAFAEAAQAEPDRVMVAPYRLHVTTVRGVPLAKPVWVHRYDTNRHVAEGDPFCHWFGLGMVWLPRSLVRAFMRECRLRNWAEGFTDCTFSMWHWRVTQREVPICWDIRPVHLHYRLTTP